MTATVTGTLRNPDGTLATGSVTFYPVRADGTRIRNFYTASGTYVGEATVDLVAGVYSVTLPSQADVDPDGLRIVRQWKDAVQQLVVPVSGTVNERDILAEPLDSVSPAALTARLTRARLGVNSAALTLSFLNFVLVPNTVISVPNIARTVEVWAVGNIQPSLSGQCAAAIVPEGSTALGTDLAIFWVQVLANNNVGGFAMEFDVAPSTPGNYQLAVYGASGTMIVAAKTSLTANAV